jgi:hypothetical protein
MLPRVAIEPAAKRGWYVAKFNGAIVHMGRNKRNVRSAANYLLRALPPAPWPRSSTPATALREQLEPEQARMALAQP